MAELKNDEEQQQQRGQALPAKRNPDLISIDENKDGIGIENGAGNENGDSKKKQKSEFSADDTIFPYVAEEKEIDDEDEYITDDDSSDDEDDEDEDEDEDDEDSDEHSNGKAEVVDHKGKGILRDDKGKGKMIEESDDTSDGLDDTDGDSSDLSDDPLAEVDLDNILPSRTRGRAHRPGVHISDDLGNNVKDDNDDSDA